MLDPTPKYIEEIIRQIKHLQSDIIISKANFSGFQENIKELTIEEVEAKLKKFFAVSILFLLILSLNSQIFTKREFYDSFSEN